jgi:hypothetical protein
MINIMGRAAVRWMVVALMSVVAAPAVAQAPSEAQREAIKTDCRNDYIAHCSSIPPGGEASLQCLAKNMSSLSPSCQAAVRAAQAPAGAAAPKAATTPAATNAKPAAAPAAGAAPTAAASTPAKQPSSAQVAAVRTACQSDYPKVCAGVPPGGAPALQCLDKNKAKVSAGCQQAVNAATGGTAAPVTGGAAPTAAAAPAAAPVSPLVLRKMLPREELFVTRSACAADISTLCQGVVPGGGRIMQCLSVRSASLSPACRDVLTPFAVQ